MKKACAQKACFLVREGNKQGTTNHGHNVVIAIIEVCCGHTDKVREKSDDERVREIFMR